MKLLDKVGIYGIKNHINDKVYIGYSKHIKERYVAHLRDLRRGTHYNKYLQRSFSKYGETNFELVILEECEIDQLPIKEQKWISNYPRNKVFNFIIDTLHLQGTSNPFFGHKHTCESKQKMSNWKKNNYLGKNNPNYGKKYSKDVCIKGVLNNTGTKLSIDKVLEIVDLLNNGEQHQIIADRFNVNRTVITRISNGTRWTNVTGGPITPIVKIDGVRQFSENHRKRIGASHLGKKYIKSKTKKVG